MKKYLFLLAVVVLAATSFLSAAAAEPLRVFIRAGAKTHGPGQHDHPRFLREWTQLLNERGAKATGATEFPTAAQLNETDVLIIHAPDGMRIVGEDRENFENFLKHGGGVVVLHAGLVSGDQHEWCKSIIGGAWRWPSPTLPRERATKYLEGEVNICWLDQNHPISRDASNFDWKDEIYYDLDLAPDIGVLASSFHNVFVIAPQLWTYEKTLGNGAKPYRAFVSIPGHEYESFNQRHYRAILLRGIAWAGKRANADEFCKAEELAALRFPPGGPLPAAEAIKTFNLHPEFNIGLTADEKVAEKIMSVDWDPQGRLWVVETPEYPGGRDIHPNDNRVAPWRLLAPEKYPAGNKEPRPARDRISILEDTNGDGVMDKRTVFADGLELPTSAVFYKDGVIVTQAPDILWIRDTNGDGKADKIEVLFTGWGTFDTHAVTSNLRWGPDGWIYGSVGYSSGDVSSGDGRKNFGRITAGLYRFRPDGSAIEQVAAGSCNTWGCEVAPDGEIFFSTATCGEPILHVVVPEKIISQAGVPGVRAAKPIIEENKVFPARHETRQPYVQIDWVGAFTAASGATIYDGGAWPAKWRGPSWSFFVHEPTVWLTHHEFLDPVGVTYQGRREEGRKDTHFLTSTDYWFKPIHARVGPDGALYLVDFYNQIAAHNDTRGVPHGARNAATRPDRNHEFTRLYRIQHKQAEKLPAYELNPKNATKLVAMLDHPNGWVRATANRLLSEGAGNSVVDALKTQTTRAATAYGRMQALWVLHNLNKLDAKTFVAAARDTDPVVRKNALRIASEQHIGVNQLPLELLRALLADTNQRVRLEALTAAASAAPTREVANAIVAAWPTLQNQHLETAALAVSAGNPLLFLDAAFAATNPSELRGMIPALARQVALENNPASARALVISLAGKPAATDALKALALQSLVANLKPEIKPASDTALGNALRQLLSSEETASAVLPLLARWDYANQVGDAVKAAVAKAESRLADRSLSDAERGQVAANLLGIRSLDATIVPAVGKLIGGDASAELQRRLIEALGATGDKAAGRLILAALPRLDFDLREIAIGQLIQRPDWSMAVLEEMANGKLTSAVLGLANIHRLRTHPDKAVADRATAVLTQLHGAEQKEKDVLIAQLRPEVIKPGNAANGAKLFTQNCAPCHRFKNEGAEFAPNLTGMGAHGPEDLLLHILDPNRVVEPNYTATTIETKDELTYDGIVLRENNRVVVMRTQSEEIEIRKDNIAFRQGSSRSMMPEGFEQLGAEGLRDLLTFLCAGDEHYRIIDLTTAATANTARGIYIDPNAREASLRFRKWGTITHRDIPFDIVNPVRTATGNNVIVLKGNQGMSREYPQEVEVKVGLAATKLHFLASAGWGYPYVSEKIPAAKITVHFAGGATEVFELRNGVEIADCGNRTDVPGSEALKDIEQLLRDNRQIRYFAKSLTKRGVVEKLTLASYNNELAPTFVSITAELGDSHASGKSAAAPANSAFAWKDGLKVLITGGGDAHDYERWFHQADVKILNETDGITAHYTDKTGDLADVIAEVDVLIISNNKPFTDAATKAAIFKHVENGKGLIGLHPGLWYNWRDWPEYNRDLIGGGSRGHDRLGEFEVIVTEPNHPLVHKVPEKFTIKDELYYFEPAQNGPAIQILATAQSKQRDQAYPQLFTVAQPKGRVVGLTLGHDGDAHNHPAYIQLLRNAVFWAAGKEPK